MASISTKKGDTGTTLLSDGSCVSKDSMRVEAYGSVDELSSQLGLILASDCTEKTRRILNRISHELFTMGSDLSSPLSKEQKRITEEQVERLTNEVNELEDALEPLRNFILPGGCKTAALIHVARSTCRRAERNAVLLSNKEDANPEAIKYLNRLSDVLFLLARFENKSRGLPDTKAEF